jgi:hypothetical protein
MRINIKQTDKNVALLKQLASKDRVEAEKAHLSLAEFIGPVLQEVINTAPTMSALFSKMTFNENDSPSIPLDLYTNVSEEDYLRVWSQSEPGGMPYNQPTPPTRELKFSTYRLDSAIAFHKKFAQQSRLDVVGKTMERLAQEILVKQERNSAAMVLRALAQATTNIKGVATRHVIRSQEADRFLLHDFNRMFTLIKRIYSSWTGGTPAAGTRARGLTDIVVSPEIVQELRSLAYNPINTRAGVVTGDVAQGVAVTSIALPDAQRQAIYNNGGVPEFYGVNIMEINELGIGYKYNDLFDFFAGATTYPDHGATGGAAAAFDGATEEIIIGLDLGSMQSLVRPVAVDAENGAEFRVSPDNQFFDRAGKVGFYGALEEGRLILDDRVLTGIIV